ncbi:endolytic transglycosylase MltG [Streptomyces bathyalis]|uniref:Endolytic murein transglycosylase n=1 Tax=Streptomyces bathyalis TaxID=2710756 RepID=A0A7T1WV46_9ACTN|nr:endolytic transglycosylase MltG [Streptomyces bathyalis]QPP09852.1 endolytic transglycosylase MltG [Streptomyces bathyalis]
MTEYGRGQSLPPWHPDDPLFGDKGWDGGRDGTHPGDGDPYAGQYADPYSTGQHQVPHQQQGYYTQQPQQQQYYGQGGYEGPAAGGHYDPGYGMGATDPNGMPTVTDPYNTGQQPGYYGAQQGFPQQQPQGQGYPGPYAQPVPEGYAAPPPGRPDADPETGWDPGPDQGEHAFFSERDDSDDDLDDDEGRSKRSGRRNRGGETKRRSGCACLAVSVLLAGGLGTAGYFGYDLYQTYLAPAPDYPGKGSGQAQVKIPDGASIADMGTELQKAGVVKSARAFVEAAEAEQKASGIQPGTYSLRKKMSGAAAVKLMLDPASQNGLIISEGLRAKKIYELIDEKLGKAKGTTEKTAKNANSTDLGLPAFAKGNPEGFLFPSRYSVGQKSDPLDVLRDMVGRAKAEHTKVDLAGEARKAGKTPEEILTIASLIQAEAQQDGEFGKVSRVIHNRLDKDILLQFDSTINYAKGRSSLDTSVEDTKLKSPYNTYLNRGLPPGPIDNPGHQAIEAALNPTKGNWIYFVTVKPGDTRFTASKAEHDRNVQDFNKEQRKKKENGG